jgi:lysophospholipase
MNQSTIHYMMTSDGTKIRFGHWSPEKHLSPSLFKETAQYSDDVKGTVVIMQGRASFIEKFEEVIEGLLIKGHEVWSFDWRGQGLSSRMTSNRHQGYIDSYDTFLRDFHQLMIQEIKPKQKGPLIALGQSMGAHVLLRYLSEYPGCFDAAVLTSPMLDLITGGYPKPLARAIARMGVYLGFSQQYVFGHGDYEPWHEPFEDNLLTHNREIFFKHRRLQIENPLLSIGGVTFGWLKATFDSIETLLNKEYLARIKIPLLVIAAGEEMVVDNTPLSQVCEWLKDCRLKIYEGARHQILNEIDPYMNMLWKDFDHFMEDNFERTLPLDLTERRFVKSPELSAMKRLDPSISQDLDGLKPNF